MEKFASSKNIRLIVFRDIVSEEFVHIFVDCSITSPISGKLSHSVNELWQSEHRLPEVYKDVQGILEEIQKIVEVRGITLHYDNAMLGNFIRFVAQTSNKDGEVDKLTKLLM